MKKNVAEIALWVAAFLLFAIKFRSCWIDDPIDPITRQIITEREAAPW